MIVASLRKKAADELDYPAPAAIPATEKMQSEASTALKRQAEALHRAESLQQQQHVAAAVQHRRAEWLAANPLAQRNVDVLDGFHREALQQGHADLSDDYFNYLNDRLATLDQQPPPPEQHPLIDEMQLRAAQNHPPPPAPERVRTNIVSAPVSREVPSASGSRSNGKITLTPQHLEAARIAGVTPAEYGKQLLRLREMQASGEYSDRR
jgi:hypothetical protein